MTQALNWDRGRLAPHQATDSLKFMLNLLGLTPWYSIKAGGTPAVPVKRLNDLAKVSIL